MKRVFIAGATGYLGRYLCAEYTQRGWHVTALVRNPAREHGLKVDQIVEAEATVPSSLKGVMAGVDLVISALGITRQADGLGYWDVDYQANVNLLDEALHAGVSHFGYVHVLNADRMGKVPLVAAKSAFVRKLQLAPLRSTVVAPSGYFSDMEDFLAMARSGRVWLFGSGAHRINPIHGADLAAAAAGAVARQDQWLDVGGPDMFSQNDLARLCFQILGKKERITHLPDHLRRVAIRVLPKITPRRISGPAQFFLTAMGMEMTGQPHGNHHLADHFRKLLETG